ncbi:cellulose synthase subunit BcsC-related outer membrane protein [Granulicella sp. WH15]|uniref:cellulose synthase subunit BcsC-related outer membrane protein n=1 Tax=Granulicella sp. WH15 TaxID=2602070 RepID=UPI0013A53861|nr:cellulose synthase subunit BcsC-related outer membrane protein [Granulicella sp. WH15]
MKSHSELLSWTAIRPWSPSRLWAPALMLGLAGFSPACVALRAQVAGQSATRGLLDKADTLEQRGRMDMASQTWQQVLLADPRNTEALAGLARAAKLNGDQALAKTYLDRLRAINPNDPGIQRAESLQTRKDNNTLLQQAGRLAQAGQYEQAMQVYRQIYGNEPPPGDAALGYYETEAATEAGRAHAIAGLRALAAKFPSDSRYQVQLGRILTYNPKTRTEGRRLLEGYPKDSQAIAALRQALLWDAQSPASAADIKAYLAQHQDAQLAQALKDQPHETPRAAADRVRSAEDQAGYRALNAKHLDEAERHFKASLAENPNNANALAGMGYIRMQQSNFGGAINFLAQAKANGAKDPGLDAALATSRFWNTMADGAAAVKANDLSGAEKNYRQALMMRPGSPEALEALGGTLLTAQKYDAAETVFAGFVKARPQAPHAWRGLFQAQYGGGNAPQAIETEQKIPVAVRAQLMQDPIFLQALASAYTDSGRPADAQQVLQAALNLPVPADAKGLESDTQMQFAGLLVQANRLDQAYSLYRKVLERDPKNIDAWKGLVRVQHAMGQDAQALQTIASMAPPVYDAAMRDAGFDQTVASINQGENRLDVAQEVLERAIAAQSAAGQKPSTAVEIQLAGIYLLRGNAAQAYPIYQKVLTAEPERLDAWKGLLSALHSTGRDREALAEVQQIPTPVRARLEGDVDYLQTVGSIYSGLGQPAASQNFMARVQQYYTNQRLAPPADISIQNAWLLYNSGNDQGLYRELMTIGGRADLTDEQRRTVQTIWTSWAVRRASQAAASGHSARSLEILNAAARAFPDNPGVLKALAGGYASAGQNKQAILIWKAQDLSNAPAADYKAAVGVALAADDMKDAETWLRFGLNQYPQDAQMLLLGAKFEQARGDTNRAAEYYRASLQAMQPSGPADELAAELTRPLPSSTRRGVGGRQSHDLPTLLQPGLVDGAAEVTPPPVDPLYLPSFGDQMGVAPAAAPAAAYPYPSGGVNLPSYRSNPATAPYAPPAAAPVNTNSGARTTLRDYVPQASSDAPVPMDGTEIPQFFTAEAEEPEVPQSRLPEGVPSPAEVERQQIARLTQQAIAASALPPIASTQSELAQSTMARPLPPGVLTQQPTGLISAPAPMAKPQSAQNEEVYGAYVPYVSPVPTPVRLGSAPVEVAMVQPEVTDILPMAQYAPEFTAYSRSPEIAAAKAAAARRQKANANSEAAVSAPPVEEYSNAPTRNAQYVASGQQAPQPSTRTRGRARAAQNPAPASAPQQAAPAAPGLTYPGVGVPPAYQSYSPSYPPSAPTPAPAYFLGQPPTDADLAAKDLPPLRGIYDANAPAQLPLTQRQQAERDLAALEGSYSGWLGGTGYGRYRSGRVGLDRLSDLETSFEASAMLGNSVRLSVIPTAIFLNNGAVDPNVYTGSGTVLGSYLLENPITPAQQYASGLGGEVQVATQHFAAAVGYTPYDFLVRNVTGRLSFQPIKHFTLFGERQPVKETQLSYAGLRDPGSATPVFGGNIWGGVVSTGGGIRFDLGDERSGFYISADGSDLTGVHTLENSKFEGLMGAYFLAHTWPAYGKLNVGATLYGAHFAHNERGMSYGLGGYFSPNVYFLAAIPVSFTGAYKTNFHYSIAGSVGLQTFAEDNAIFFPLDPALQTAFSSNANCTLAGITAHSAACAQYPTNSDTGLNYGLNAEGAYRIADHWYAGGFLSANNTNNYNSVSGGFFIRYMFRPQVPTENYPTGLFPTDGFRPVRVP